MTTKSARIEGVAALVLTAAAVAVLVTRVRHAGPLWRDESGALAIAQLPGLGAMFREFPHEAFPLAFPLTVRAWIEVAGSSDASLRVFGAGVAALLIAALWLHARLSGTYPLASLSLFVLSPLALFVFSIRGYGLACVATVFALAAHRLLVERVSGRRLLAASIASLVAAHAAMHDAALLLAIGGAAAAVSLRRQGVRAAAAILAADALVAASLAVYIPSLARARLWDVSQRAIPWSMTVAGFRDEIGNMPLIVAFIATAVAIVVALLGWRRETPAGRDFLLFYLACLPMIVVVYVVWLQVLGYAPRTWYFVPVAAVGAACLDALLAARMRPRAGPVVALLCIGISIWLLPRTLREARVRTSNVDLVAAALARSAAPHDLVVVNPWYCGVSFARYFRGPAPWTTLPPIDDHRMHRYDLLLLVMSRPNALQPLLKQIEATLRSGNDVWLVGSFDKPAPGETAEILAPAPHPSSGWADAPYVVSWSLQLGQLLDAHSTLVQKQLLLKRPTSGYETLALRTFRGWRDVSAAPAPGR